MNSHILVVEDEPDLRELICELLELEGYEVEVAEDGQAGLARAMARFASAADRSDRQSTAAAALTQAMMAHPDLVAGEGRACPALMRALTGRGAVKTGAEGVFVAILPELKLGVALKIADGATRASECALATILTGMGVLDSRDPVAQRYLAAPITNRRDVETGTVRPAFSV